MTPQTATSICNRLKLHAAFDLQPAGAMRSLLACATLAAGLLVCSATARAQTSSTAGLGTCSGTSFAGSVGLSVPNSSGALQSVASTSVPYVFGNAECACSPTAEADQVHLQIFLTSALGIGTTGSAQVWVGNGCDNYTTRTTANQTQCELIATPDIQLFTTASGVGTSGIQIPIPGVKLMSPISHMCTDDTATNSVYVFIYSNPQSPFATCTLNLNEQNRGPQGVTGVTAGGGDGAVDLNWMLPAAGSFNLDQIQILCSDDCGMPCFGSHPDAIYSTCVNGVLVRRTLPTGGSIGTTVDGGTTTDGGTMSRTGGQLHPLATPVMNCTPDGGMNTTFVNDMGAVGLGPLSSLDPRFLVGTALSSGATGTRISGLTNFKHYYFAVVAVDKFGNPTVSDVVAGTPQPTEDLYRRIRDAGGPAGHCFIATAAFGSYESGWVQVLRDFRDRSLLPTAAGRAFVDWYYAHSPAAADVIARHGWLRALVRVALLPLIALAFFWVHFAAWQKALLLTLLAALLLRKRILAAHRTARASSSREPQT
jgi:hypothetical protein